MKVVILAGGFGTRLSELTGSIPKPMAQIGPDPIIVHIMEHYARYGHKEFIIACGYKAEVIKDYFSKIHILRSDFSVKLGTGDLKVHKNHPRDWSVTLVDTGLDTMTGGRIKRLEQFITNEPFLLTYGDGLSDVDINESIATHNKGSAIVSMTAVRPAARFGELVFSGNKVEKFEEKPQLDQGWINGGFFVCEPELLDYIDGDHEMLEREPMQRLMKQGGIGVFPHDGFWHCMDSKRDFDKLNSLWAEGKAPWVW